MAQVFSLVPKPWSSDYTAYRGVANSTSLYVDDFEDSIVDRHWTYRGKYWVLQSQAANGGGTVSHNRQPGCIYLATALHFTT